MKGGAAVEDCEVADFTHVFRDEAKRGEEAKPWTVTLNAVDVASGKNAFYKLQLLQHDQNAKKSPNT